VARSPQARLLDRTARRYGTRPSALLGIEDRALALDLDSALALRAHTEDDEAIEQVMQGDEDGLFFSLVITLLRMAI
jgi:hypothetical protein